MADRVEREIEEILSKIDDIGTARVRRQRRVQQQQRANRPAGAASGWLGRTLARVSLQKVMVWALFALVVALFLPGIPGKFWFIVGALIVLGTAYMLSRSRSTIASPPKRWRGEVIDYSGPSLPNRLKGWLKGRRRA